MVADTREAKILPGPPVWKLETAKAKFSEVVRLAKSERPQTVTYRGRREVVVLDAAEYDRLCAKAPRKALVQFLETLHMDGVSLVWDEGD